MTSLLDEPPAAIDPERLEKLVGLFHLRWNVPLIASMGENPAFGRVAVLAKRLDVGRSTVHRTLKALSEREWVRPNPGYGHPLRPEFILVGEGHELAPWCNRFHASMARRKGMQRLGYQKWSMAILWLIGTGRRRFASLEEALPSITPRALSQALKTLGGAGLVERCILDSTPVQVEYKIVGSGRSLFTLLNAFFE